MTQLLRPRTRTTPVHADDDGRLAGFHREHWDDAVDAKVIVDDARGVRVHIPEHGIRLAPYGHLFPAPEQRPVLNRHGRIVPVIAGGAFATNSGLYVTNWIDILDATQLAIDTSLTSHKWAMYTNSIATMSYSTDVNQTSAPYNANEASGTGYTVGGQTILSPTTTESPSGTLMYDMADQVWAAPTSVTARGAVLYADVLTNNNLIVAMTFGADFTSTAGTFTIQFASTGVFTIDLTP
jgi:hypothetical protein